MYLFDYEEALFRNHASYRTMKYLWCVVPPLLLLVGTFGNVMVLIVLRSRSHLIPAYIYLMAISVADEVILLVGLNKRWLQHLYGIELDCLHPLACKLFHCCSTCASYLSVWLIVAVTAERLVVITKPLKASVLFSVRRAKITVAIICLAVFTVNIHWFFTVTTYELGDTYIVNGTNHTDRFILCDYKREFISNINQAWPWIDATLYTYAPFFLITVFNVIIIRSLRIASHRRETTLRCHAASSVVQVTRETTLTGRSAASRTLSSGSDRGQVSQVTTMLLCVSIYFLVTAFPVAVIKTISGQYGNQQTITNETRAVVLLVNTVAELLMFGNHMANFFLYCAVGQRFRSDLKSLARRCRAQLSHTAVNGAIGTPLLPNPNHRYS